MQDDSRARSRDRLLYLLKTKGPQTAAELAQRLRLTQAGVRQHLQGLGAEELVEHREERRGVGRPVRIWSLAAGAAEHFPDSHGELTVDLLDALRESFGDDGVDRLLDVRMRRQLESYRDRLPASDAPIEKRVAALAAIRRQEGYMAEWRRSAGGFLLVENHCPICAAATACQGLCRDELRVFQNVLGPGVSVERSEHMLDGARRCAYRISPVSDEVGDDAGVGSA